MQKRPGLYGTRSAVYHETAKRPTRHASEQDQRCNHTAGQHHDLDYFGLVRVSNGLLHHSDETNSGARACSTIVFERVVRPELQYAVRQTAPRVVQTTRKERTITSFFALAV